jgi:geranylgeranyl diphosphate synthase, type I
LTSTALQRCSEEMLPYLEKELQAQVNRINMPGTEPFHDMLTYHMGWTGLSANAASGGKRIRPLMMMLAVASYDGKWLRALPAAAAIELIHNFSLVHDDIEDNSPTRRGRLTLWKMHGIPMATNAGDALFAISNQAMLDTYDRFPAETVLEAARVLHSACTSLTRGQYLDMSYEKRHDLQVADYWTMVEGKTAALLSAAARIGAIFGGAAEYQAHKLADFGKNLGLAFQVEDDILGVWGDEATTGKSAASDLVEGKNSLPILYGVGQHARFAERWAAGPVTAAETIALAQLLKDEGAYAYAEAEAERLTALAMDSLHAADPRGEAGEALAELAAKLLNRKS